jgi:substrate import-associated zinc metallohydrolase lipoprotein
MISYKNKTQKLLLISLLAFLSSCTGESPLTQSQLNTTAAALNVEDVWINNNYTDPYNIRVYYQWDQKLVDYNRFLFPPMQSKVLSVLEIVKKIWIDSYTTVGGEDFIKKIAPREIVLVGGVNRNSNGTITLGEAAGGKRITLFNTDLVEKTDRFNVTQFVHTIQHEYIHILNQQFPFDEKAYANITPTGYTSSWSDYSTADARKIGFITAYSRSNITEDFAEVAATMLTSTKIEYDKILFDVLNVPIKTPTPTGPKTEVTLDSQKSYDNLKAKEALIVAYFKNSFKMDFYKLRTVAEANTDIVVK